MRARELGLSFGPHPAGQHNAITDVAGVRVGHVTVIEGEGIRTGVTAIVPDAVDRAGGSLAAGLFAGNGYGKLIGVTQLAELGEIESPVVLTGTLSAFRAADALLTYLLRLPGNEQLISANPVVGETNDGYLSDIRARPITEEHVLAALSGATRRAGRRGRGRRRNRYLCARVQGGDRDSIAGAGIGRWRHRRDRCAGSGELWRRADCQGREGQGTAGVTRSRRRRATGTRA